MKMNGEKGQALPLVVIAVVLGMLVVTPFVGYADSSILGSKTFGDSLRSQYATDSGAEHAIWRLTDNNLISSIPNAGSTVSYSLAEALNGLTTNITVCNSWQAIATDNFNSGGWTGGTGWLDNWTHSGESTVTNSGTPFEGTYHLRLRSSTGLVSRSVDLSHEIGVHLRFWGKVSSFDWGDEALCQVSSDGIEWNTVYTFTFSDDNEYRQYDCDLTSYEMTSQFWIRFDAEMDSTNDNLYVDKLEVIWLIADPIVFAWDDFESWGWAGGGGWTANWTHSGYSEVTFWGSPYEGWCHLRLRSSTGDVQRPTNLSAAGESDIVRLRFWAKVNSFESSDNALCRVSPNGSTWTTIYTWTRSHSDNDYHYYDLSLAAFEMTSQFWIRFDCNGNNTNDYFYVDKIEIVSLEMFGITVKAGDSIIKATVRIDDGVVHILTWYYV